MPHVEEIAPRSLHLLVNLAGLCCILKTRRRSICSKFKEAALGNFKGDDREQTSQRIDGVDACLYLGAPDCDHSLKAAMTTQKTGLDVATCWQEWLSAT